MRAPRVGSSSSRRLSRFPSCQSTCHEFVKAIRNLVVVVVVVVVVAAGAGAGVVVVVAAGAGVVVVVVVVEANCTAPRQWPDVTTRTGLFCT